LDEFGEKFFKTLVKKIPASNIVKIELNMKTGDSTYTVIDKEFGVDLPQVSHDLIGYESQFAYMPYLHKELPDD